MRALQRRCREGCLYNAILPDAALPLLQQWVYTLLFIDEAIADAVALCAPASMG